MDKPLEVAVAVESFAKTAKIANKFAEDILTTPPQRHPEADREAARWIGVRRSCLERIEALLKKPTDQEGGPCTRRPGCVLREHGDTPCAIPSGAI